MVYRVRGHLPALLWLCPPVAMGTLLGGSGRDRTLGPGCPARVSWRGLRICALRSLSRVMVTCHGGDTLLDCVGRPLVCITRASEGAQAGAEGSVLPPALSVSLPPRGGLSCLLFPVQACPLASQAFLGLCSPWGCPSDPGSLVEALGAGGGAVRAGCLSPPIPCASGFPWRQTAQHHRDLPLKLPDASPV